MTFQKRKIAIVRSNSISSDTRGTKVAKSLGRRYEVLILGWDRECEYEPIEILGEHITIKRFRFKAPYGTLSLALFLPIYHVWVLLNLLLYNPDGVHACDLDGAIPSYIFKMVSRKKMVFDVFDRYGWGFIDLKMKKLYPFIRFLEEAIASNSDFLIVISKMQLDTFERLPRFRVVIPNYPPNLEIRKRQYPSKVANDILKLVFAGGVCFHRGLVEILKVIKDLKDVRLVIAGTITNWDLFRQLPSFSNVEYVGVLPHKKALELQASADAIPVLVDPKLPMTRTVMPAKLFEAMMLAVPIITNVLADLVTKLGCGIVVRYGDVDDIRNAILCLKNNPRTRKEMGSRGHAAFERGYNWNRMEEKLLRVYEKLLV